MNVNTKSLVSITEANQNFSKVARLVDENGSAVILKNNVPRYLIVEFSQAENEQIAVDEDVIVEKKEVEEQKATDTALKVAKIVKADIERRFNAVREVRHVLGDVNAMKYNSAGRIYKDALAKMGVNVKRLRDSECRAVFRAVSAVKVKSKDCSSVRRVEKTTALDKLFNRISVLEGV